MSISGMSQVDIARELDIDRGTVRLDLDAMRGKFEETSQSYESLCWGAYDRAVALRDEVQRQAREAKGSLKAKLYEVVRKMDCKILDRFVDPALMTAKADDRFTEVAERTIAWIGDRYGADELSAFLEFYATFERKA